jgi:hypothetical protein
MISPHITIVRRIRKNRQVKRRSIRDISRRYLQTEHARFLAVELVLFLTLAAIAMWPIADAFAVIEKYLW